ncbi:MAG: GDP-L-fucose synthase [Nitrospirae bacterium]|nr:GDP-L-fucose synthase [Nitrospirota bacterium]
MTKSIYIAGHTGLIGSALLERLGGEDDYAIITRTHSQLDLSDHVQVDRFFEKEAPEICILAAGRVGGIIANRDYPADFITENLAIQLNVFRAARHTGVKKLIFFGSSCMYPRECPQPMNEDQLLTGKPEPTSMAYAISKLAGVEMCLAYNRQYGARRFLPVIPNNVYGPRDNFDSKSSHVLPGLIRKFHEAREKGLASVTLWGTGTPRREFIYVDDVADAVSFLLEHDTDSLEFPLNMGVGYDNSIKDLAEIVCNVVGYIGQIKWDTSKPDGAPRKLLDSSRLKVLGWRPKVGLEEGIKNSYQWYLKNMSET